MKTSNIQTTHTMAIIRGWVDGLAAGADSGGSATIVDVDVENGDAGALAAGDVVVLQSDGTVAKTTTAADTRPVGVVQDAIAVGEFGAVAWAGPVDLINVVASVTAGDYAETSTTGGSAQSAGTTPGTGTFGYFTSSGTTPSGFLTGFGGGGLGVTYGTPALTLGTANAAGSTDEAIRRDATILAFDATAPTTQAFGDSAATGSAAVAARRDHKHAMPGAAVTSSGLTMATARLLGRTTASTGAVEEITVGSGLSLSAGSLTATGGGGSGTDLHPGISFPGSPSDNDLCYRTDRDVLYFYDSGTSQWLSVQIHSVSLAPSFDINSNQGATATMITAAVPFLGTYSLYLLSCYFGVQLVGGGTSNGSNKWSLDLNYYDTSSSRFSIGSADTSGVASGNANTVVLSINAALNAAAVILEERVGTKTGSPPNYYFWGSHITYRLIG